PFPLSRFPSVFDAEPLQLLRRASLPFGHDHVAHVAEVLHAHLAGPEPRRRQVAETVEERDAGGESGLGPLGPRDVVEHGGALGGALHLERREPEADPSCQDLDCLAAVHALLQRGTRNSERGTAREVRSAMLAPCGSTPARSVPRSHFRVPRLIMGPCVSSDPRCTRSSATPAPGSSTSGSCPPATRKARRP